MNINYVSDNGDGTITISGIEFEQGVTVSVGGIPASDVIANSDGTNITCTLGQGVSGVSDVIVSNTDGQNVTKVNGFVPFKNCGGTGTSNDPYLICTAAQLQTLGANTHFFNS